MPRILSRNYEKRSTAAGFCWLYKNNVIHPGKVGYLHVILCTFYAFTVRKLNILQVQSLRLV